MKKHRGKPIVHITDPKIEEYAEQHSQEESPDVHKLIASSDKELEFIDMLSGKLVGQFLKMLVSVSGAKRILEVGTFTGYSAVMMAEALPEDGELITIEMNLRYQALSEMHFRESGAGKKIRLIKGNAREILNDLEPEFDLVYLDADKLRYELYYEQILPLLKAGGLLLVDNVLWDGTVLDPEDDKSRAIRAFNQKVSEDERVEKVLLPIRDGVYMVRKR